MNLALFFLTILILLILWSAHRSISTLFIFLRFLLYKKYHLYWGWEPAPSALLIPSFLCPTIVSQHQLSWQGRFAHRLDRRFGRQTFQNIYLHLFLSLTTARRTLVRPQVFGPVLKTVWGAESVRTKAHMFSNRRSRWSDLFGPFWITVILRYFCALSFEASLTR